MPIAPTIPHDVADTSGRDTEIGRQEARLKASALQNAVFNSANFSSIATDARGLIQIFNAGAERMLGYAAADVVNQIMLADLSDPLELLARAKALRQELGIPVMPGFDALVLKASHSIEDIYELTFFRKDGSRFPATVSVTALRDDQEAIIGYLLIGTDNTARKQAEEALLKAGALQSAIFNSANFSSIATDAKGVIQIFNVGAERMLGYTALEVMNKITPADISDPQEVIARAEALSVELGTPITPGFEALVFKASRGIEDIYELTYFRKDGSRFPAIVSVTALRDDQDAIIGYLLIGTDNTARKQAEEALLKAGALQSAIFNSANFSSIATDAKGVIQIFNVGAERMLGYTALEVMNKITPADISDPQEVIARAEALSVELGTPITPGFEALVFKASRGIEDIYELTYFRKDGSRFPAIVSVTALRDDQDSIIGYLLIGTDNTARKQAEEALLKAGALQSAIFNSANFSSIATDAKGVIQIFNVGAERMLGYTALEVMNKITPADISDPQEVIARAEALSVELGTAITPGFEALVFKASRGIEDIYELTYFRKDGSRFPAIVSVTALRDDQDTIIGYLLIGTDNTARKQAEEALLKAGALQSAIFNSANFSSIATDAKGVIQIFNVGAERMLGYTALEVMNKITPADISDPLEVVARAKALSEELGTPITPGFEALVFKASRGIEDIYELTYIRRDGSRFPAVVSVTALRDAQNTIIGYLLIGTDISARKQAEETAQAALLAKSQFLANMSHEIRTPMNAILGLTRIVMESDLKPEQREQLDKVSRSGRALVRIIDDILDFSRIEAGRLTIELIPMRVEAVLLEVAELLGLQAEDKGLQLSLNIDHDAPLLVMSDPFRLVQVLNNLVGNAIKFTERGEIHIGVQVAHRSDDAITLRFNVSDTGIGIEPDQVGVLFQPFSQADSSTTRKFGGSGLGLAIVKKLVGLLGGQVTLDSVPGKGTNIAFTIVAGIAPEEIGNVTHLGRELQQMRSKRVLVVDDQSNSRHILSLLLKAWGMEVVEAENGPDALAQVAEAIRIGRPFYSMLLDWHMPGMSGLAVAAELRELERASGCTQPLPILMVTAHNKPTLMQQPEAAYITGVLTKPVIPSFLFDALLHGKVSRPRTVVEPSMQRFDGVRVLLVEDNELNQEVAASIIRKRGATLTIASHGSEAVELVQRQTFDLVLMDLHMPVMGGIEATRRIRELPQGKHLPIVAMTAAVMAEDRERCRAIGMVDFIPKPVEPEDIVKVLSTYTRARRELAAGAPLVLQTGEPILELVQGLRRLDGDRVLQQRLLCNFVDSYRNLIARLNALLTEGRTDDAIDLIHSVKGIGANLSAIALAEACRHLLEELTASAPLLSRPAFEATLALTLVQMDIQIAAYVAPGRPALGAAGLMSLAEMLASLDPYVASQEIIPDALLAACQHMADANLPGSPLLRELQHHFDRFEHADALATFAVLKAKYGELA
ncbi:MAG: PAS domain S-box protein [Pseudomonadota bacterium]